MGSKKEGLIYIMALIFTPVIVYFTLGFMIMGAGSPGKHNPESFILLLISILSGFGMIYFINWVRNEYFPPQEINFDEINQPSSEESYPVGDRSEKRKKSGSLNIFSSENECDTCGTEMEYKEEMDCYYCPECHEYK